MTSRCFKDSHGATLELQEVDGVLYPYLDNLPQQLQDLRRLHVRNDDVLLCTYPKAGTHWLWEVLTMLVNRTSTHSRFMKRIAMLETADLDRLHSEPSPRVLNTHLLPHVLPEMTWSSGCRVVVFHRNPKDSSVSLYNMAKSVSKQAIRSAFDGTYKGHVELFLNGTVPYGSWFDYVRAWENKRKTMPHERLYVGTYENMTLDTVAETGRLASFLGLDLPKSLIEGIATACSFDKLKEASRHKEGGPTFWKDGSPGIFRKGKVGDWKEWMDNGLSAAFDAAIADKMADLDIDFIYDLDQSR